MAPKITLLSGGVGGAKLALGLYHTIPPENLTIIGNTGDDINMFGLRICPDTDILLYTLAGVVNENQGWGRKEETFTAFSEAKALGGTPWFNLGDKDLGVHLFRAEALSKGMKLSVITNLIAERFLVKSRIFPMCEEKVDTFVATSRGELHLQEYLIRERAEPIVKGLRFEGIEKATIPPGVLESLKHSDMILIAPSNPLISIGPILAVPGFKEHLKESKALKVSVCPLVGGASLKGPTDKMMDQLGHEVSPKGIAGIYHGIIDTLVFDRVDEAFKQQVADLGIKPELTQTVMGDFTQKKALAKFLVSLIN